MAESTLQPGGSDVVPGLIRLAAGDNVLVATRDLIPGPWSTSTGEVVHVTAVVPLGHKVASRTINRGHRVVRYGMAIGSATAPIASGEWVHTHNLASDYIQTFAHRGGEA